MLSTDCVAYDECLSPICLLNGEDRPTRWISSQILKKLRNKAAKITKNIRYHLVTITLVIILKLH